MGYVAVHPKTWGSTQWNNPIFPFGAFITVTKPINHQTYGEIYTFQVQDTGDLNNTKGLTRYWFDCYWGERPTSDSSAYQFGKQKRNYTVNW